MNINITVAVLLVLLAAPLSAARAEDAAPTPATPATSASAATQEAAPRGEHGGAAATAKPAKPGSGDAASKEEVRTLAEELRRLKLEIGLKDVEYQSYAGMGPAASKVYFAPKGLSIGGYGEFTFRAVTDRPSQNQSDLLRAVLYAGYRFNDRIVFNSEIEFEHAGREVSVEFAYLDFLLSEAVRLRVGNLIVPIGFVNEMHEPAFFNGVFRPDVEQVLIPSTWSENGAGLHGEVAGLRYKALLLGGLDLGRETGDEPVEAASWLRESRTGGAEARAATAAGVLNLVWDSGPLTVGGTVYGGRADQRRWDGVKANVLLAEAHAQLAWRGATARVLAVVGTLGDAGAVNRALALPSDGGLGSRAQGGYAELAYDVLSRLAPGGEASLAPFVRLERYDLNAEVPAGFTKDPGVKVDLVTAGLTYKPIPTVVVKADWQRRSSDAAKTNQLNVGAGFVF